MCKWFMKQALPGKVSKEWEKRTQGGGKPKQECNFSKAPCPSSTVATWFHQGSLECRLYLRIILSQRRSAFHTPVLYQTALARSHPVQTSTPGTSSSLHRQAKVVFFWTVKGIGCWKPKCNTPRVGTPWRNKRHLAGRVGCGIWAEDWKLW